VILFGRSSSRFQFVSFRIAVFTASTIVESFVSQAVSLDSNTRVVSIVYIVYSTSTWNTTRLRLETSVRLTVTVYSPTRELTVDRFSNEIGWKLVEVSLVEFAHNRREIPIFISVVEAFPPIARSCFPGYAPRVQSLKEKTLVSLG
jgi:hypothetical protein